MRKAALNHHLHHLHYHHHHQRVEPEADFTIDSTRDRLLPAVHSFEPLPPFNALTVNAFSSIFLLICPRLLSDKHIGYNFTTLPWAPYGHHWRNLRQIASIEILSTNRLLMLFDVRADEVRSMIRRLFNGSSGEFQLVEMKSMFFEMTLNILMRIIAGKRYYGENNTVEMEEVRDFQQIVTETFWLSGAINIGDFVPVLKWLGFSGMEKKLEVLQRKRDGFMQGLIEDHRRRKRSESDRKTMMDVLLSLQETEP